MPKQINVNKNSADVIKPVNAENNAENGDIYGFPWDGVIADVIDDPLFDVITDPVY